MMQKCDYSVYVHTNKSNGKKYVGVTRQLPEKRWQRGYGYLGMYFENAIKKYGWDGFKHEIIASGLSREDAYEIEISTIAKYKTNQRKFGYNVLPGGNSMDATLKYGEAHPNHQRVKMINLETGAIIRIFGSQSDAAREMDISRKGITKACIGVGCATYKGYVWEYADKDYAKPGNPGVGNYDHVKQQKAVVVQTADGQMMQYSSVKDACADLKVARNSAWRYLKKGYSDQNGRRWSYA